MLPPINLINEPDQYLMWSSVVGLTVNVSPHSIWLFLLSELTWTQKTSYMCNRKSVCVLCADMNLYVNTFPLLSSCFFFSFCRFLCSVFLSCAICEHVTFSCVQNTIFLRETIKATTTESASLRMLRHQNQMFWSEPVTSSHLSRSWEKDPPLILLWSSSDPPLILLWSFFRLFFSSMLKCFCCFFSQYGRFVCLDWRFWAQMILLVQADEPTEQMWVRLWAL